jgi:drug/metabolite transporter (DMT)-like permease
MTTATAGAYGLLLLGGGGSLSPLDVPAGVWLPLLGLGLVATAIAIQAFYAGVRRIGGARASLVSTVEPVYTVALAVLLFGEQLTSIQILGGVLVIGAVILAETGRPATVSHSRPRSD